MRREPWDRCILTAHLFIIQCTAKTDKLFLRMILPSHSHTVKLERKEKKKEKNPKNGTTRKEVESARNDALENLFSPRKITVKI